MAPDRETVASAGHSDQVAELVDRYDRLSEVGQIRLDKQTSNLFRFRGAAARPGLEVSAFDRVLNTDPESGLVEVQGMVTYEHLTRAVLPLRQAPLVVPQLKTITVGGAVAGLGIESTSFSQRPAA